MLLHFSTYLRVACGAVLLLSPLFMSSCGQRDDGLRVPECGELTYEVIYSENLRELSSIGAFLPHTATGVFCAQNFKITTAAPLSLAKVSLVHGESGIFMTITVDDIKFLADFSSFSEGVDTAISNYHVRTHNELTEICGFKSRQTSFCLSDSEGDECRVDIFSAVPNQSDDDEDDDDDDEAQAPPSSSGFGLVTAFSVRYAESNVIFLLKNVMAQPVDPEEFARPSGFIEASAKDFIVLMQLM